MKIACIRQYDSHGDWININGFIRYIIKTSGYDKVILVLEVEEVRRKHCEMLYSDLPQIEIITYPQFRQFCSSGAVFDCIDMRYPNCFGDDPPNNGERFSEYNPLYKNTSFKKDAAENSLYYSRHGIDCDVKHNFFYFDRKLDLEEKFFSELNLTKPYSIVCEYGDNLIDRKYVKHENVINFHNISPIFFDVLKVIEECDDIHLLENSLSLFVYHMQYVNLMKRNKINLHAYARKESYRKCDGPNCNNPFLNMIMCPPLENWEFIY